DATMNKSKTSFDRNAAEGSPLPSGVERVFGDVRGKTDGDLLALTYDGPKTLRSVEEGGILRRLDAQTGILLEQLSLSDLENCWAFGPDGKLLCSASDGVSFWDLETGILFDRFSENSWATCLAVSPDGELAAAGHDDDSV